jgi:PAS domain S-box-containing protein
MPIRYTFASILRRFYEGYRPKNPEFSLQIRWLVAALALVLALLAYFVLDRYRQAQVAAASKTLSLVQLIESHVANDLARIDGVLTYLAQRIDHPGLQHRLADMQASFPMIAGLNIFDAQGMLIASSDPNIKGISIADRPHFQRLRDDPKVQVVFSEAQIARTTGQWSISQARALRDADGRFLGSVNAVIALDGIGKIFDNVDVGADGGILLRNSETFKLMQRMPRHNEKDFNQPLPKSNATRQRIEAGERLGTLSFTASTDGVERLASFKVIDGFPFYVQVALAKNEYLAGWRREVAAVAGLAVLLLAVFAFSVLRLQKSAALAQTALRQLGDSERNFRTFYNSINDFLFVLNMKGDILYTNDYVGVRLLYPADELLGQSVLAVHPPERREEAMRIVGEMLTGAATHCPVPLQAKDGHLIPVETRVVGGLWNGQPALFGLSRDMTERKQAEDAVRDLLTRLQTLGRHLPGFVYQYRLMVDGTSNFPYASTGIEAIYGVSAEDVVKDASRVFAVLHPDDLVRIGTSIQRSADTLALWHESYRVNHPSGHMLWVEGQATPIRQADGSTLWHGYIHDVKERLQAVQALHESEAFAQNVLNSMPSQIAVIDHTGTILSVNATWQQFSRDNSLEPGQPTPATDVGTNYLEICTGAGDDARDARNGIVAVLEGHLPRFDLELPCPTPKGLLWFAMSVSPMSLGMKGAVIAHRDITSRKVSEQQLAQERQRMANILWGTGVGTWEWNVQTGETRFNERWAELIGTTLEELAPVSIATWMQHAHPDDLVASSAALEKHFSGLAEAFECESRMRHKDGHWIWVLDRGKLVSRTPEGLPEWMAGTHLDITERKQAEHTAQAQTEALARSNAELEQFAYVASHDLRQPLRMVNSYVQMLERRLANTLDEDTRKMMHFATEGAARMDQMLVSLLEYSRVGRKGEPMAALASRAALDEALHFLAPIIADAQATVRVSGDWPQLVASRDEFTRLWQNLIGNAVKYRAPNRAPEIDITVTPQTDGGWRFCVADNGIGIDPVQFDRLFKVFARLHTREQYEGNGIGLAVARKIVERHGGLIWVESDGAGMGSRFCFFLPAQLPGTGVSP